MQKRATIKKIRQAVKIIADKLRPQKIILFGSYAYGHPTGDSDVDFLIVVDDKKNPRQLALDASCALCPRPFPIDLVVRTSKQIKTNLKYFDPFLEDVLTKGKVLYEA